MDGGNLSNLLDALSESSIYVIDEATRKLLFYNKRCADMARGRASIGVKCYDVWPEVCGNCPLEGLGDRQFNHIVCFDPLQKKTVDVTANRIVWADDIPAVVITVTPHRLNFEEEQGFRKIEKLYTKSLVTVFDECIIVNLSTDYYVNCQKDSLWSNIPEQGKFAAENLVYGRKTVHPDDYEEFANTFSAAALLKMFNVGKKQATKRLRRLMDDGSYHVVEFAAVRLDDSDGDLWCALVYRDVQEEYLLEQRRNVELSLLATAAKTAYQMLIVVNLTENSYKMLEYGRYPVKKPGDSGCFDDLIQLELSTIRPDYREEFIRKFSREALTRSLTSGEKIVSMEVPHLGDDGEYHWHFTQVVCVESPYTEDLLEITLSRNIDEERRLQAETLEKETRAKQLLEEALEKAESANAAKSDFLSKMSHDIRTPLNAVVGMTELAMLHLNDSEKLKDYLEKISASGLHLLGLVNEVLDVSKIESGTVKLEEVEFDLNELIFETAEMVRLSVENKRQHLKISIEEDLHAEVRGDKNRLQQVLVNILDNASKYTGAGGSISLSLEELNKNEKQAGTYRFIIEDTGMGMTPEYLEHLFEPFSRADDSRISKIAGTGLGMTIVKNLVNMMDGEIKVESEYKKGTKFTVTLCLAKCCILPELASADSKEDKPFSELRVLVVEDNEINCQIAAEMLSMLGAEVETAENGKLAVEAILNNPPFYYDVVFMDIRMPVMNGYEATKAIRECKMEAVEDLPIIAMTADAFAEDEKQAIFSGMSGHIAKPISLEVLKKALANCLEWKKRKRG